MSKTPTAAAVRDVIGQSRYARDALSAHPALAGELDDPRPFEAADIERVLEGADADDEAALKTRLRVLRRRVLLRVMARDLTGRATLAEVCATMSALADAAIRVAQRWCEARLTEAHGLPRDARGRAQSLVVVGMGKLGGGELNVSSDIDLVFLYPEEGETDGARRLSNHEFFARLGKRLIALLADITSDGFVFRVDMRLRPYGESGPLVASFDALESYFVTQGREWERYAWIKSRTVTGEAAAHQALAAIVRPFVFRRYLDFPTLEAMRRLHAEVRREVTRRDLADHVKLGPGGIREIEFVAQALQLIRAGRHPELQCRPTLQVLERLVAGGWLAGETAQALARAYEFLRRTEHRLQYLEDQQTHTLPSDSGDRERIARWSGFDTWAAFETALAEVRETVTRHFQAVFGESPDIAGPAVWQDDGASVRETLAELGYRDPEATAARLAAARTSQRYLQLPKDSRRRFNALVPQLAAAAAKTANPDATLARGLDLIEAIARRAAYLALLAENPQALARVARMIAASSWAAQFVTHHPILLDELLDDRTLTSPADWDEFRQALREQLAAQSSDTEVQMNILRELHQAQVFRLLAQDLGGLLGVEALADQLSALADLMLQQTLDTVWAQQHPGEPAPGFAIIAYGKLGGKELGYVSDLDIIFLHDGAREGANEIYVRFAQRLNNWLTAHTASGALFETDLRLRPSGVSGLMVSSIEGFERYQENDAWVWEHQALTRARYCAGDPRIGAAFERVRERILRRKRDRAELAVEVLKMRKKMLDAHPNEGSEFDLKHDRGGMIDLEFIVQYLVLAHAHEHDALLGNLGNIALLGIAGRLGLIPEDLAERGQEAYREFRKRQHALRLDGARYARVPPAEVAAHTEGVRALWDLVFGETAQRAATGAQ